MRRKLFLIPLFALLIVSGLPVFASEGSQKEVSSVEDADRLRLLGKASRYSYQTENPSSEIETSGAAIWVNSPIDQVRKVVTDYKNYQQMIPGFSHSRLISRKKGTSEVYLEAPVLYGTAKLWAVVLIDPPSIEGDWEKINIRYQKGNMKDLKATWYIRSVDETHSIVKLDMFANPNLPAPSSVVSSFLANTTDQTVTSVRDRSVQLYVSSNQVPTKDTPKKVTDVAASNSPATPKE